MSFSLLPAEIIYHINSHLGEYTYILRQTSQLFRNNLPSFPVLACINRVIKDDNLELASFFNLDQLYERPQKRRRLGGELFSIFEGNKISKTNPFVCNLSLRSIQENYFYLFLWLEFIPENAKNYAAFYGRINFLEFLEKTDKKKEKSVVTHAVIGNQVESLIWLKEHGYPFKGVVNNALYTGNIKLALLLYDLGATYKDGGLVEIVERGKVESFFFIIKKENIGLYVEQSGRFIFNFSDREMNRDEDIANISRITEIYEDKLKLLKENPSEKLRTEFLGIVEILKRLAEVY